MAISRKAQQHWAWLASHLTLTSHSTFYFLHKHRLLPFTLKDDTEPLDGHIGSPYPLLLSSATPHLLLTLTRSLSQQPTSRDDELLQPHQDAHAAGERAHAPRLPPAVRRAGLARIQAESA